MDIITYALLNKKINDIVSFSFKGFKKVTLLPPIGDSQYIYLLPHGENNYDEYLWVDNRWEMIGSVNTQVDPSYYQPSVDTDGILTWKPSHPSLPPIEPVNIKGPAGRNIIGATGLDGRTIELRRTTETIDWRLNPAIELKAIYNSFGQKAITYVGDILTNIHFLNCPTKAAYGKIKTVTGFGVDKDDKDVANINCSAAGPGNFPYLGDFDPTQAEINLTTTQDMIGTMNLNTAQEGLLKLFKGLPVVKVNKIRLWIYFLDTNKQPLGYGSTGDGGIFLDLILTDRNNEWNTLISLNELKVLPDGQSLVFNEQGRITVAPATETQMGGVKLYDSLGDASDGVITQKTVTSTLNKKVEMQLDATAEKLYLDYHI